MSRHSIRCSLLAAIAIAIASAGAVAGAQQPAPRPAPRDSMKHDMQHDMHHPGPGMQGMGPQGAMMRHPAGGNVASMLLAQTAALKLTDQQVTRLAALARSADAQQKAMHAEMDSTHRAMMSGMRPGAPMPQVTPAMEARMKAAHDQMHANVRDALAVLTPDQLATAWEMRGGAGMRPMGGMPAGAMRMRQPARMAPARPPRQP